MGAILDLIHDQQYKFGNCQVLRYDRHNETLFPSPFLTKLYRLTCASGRRSKSGKGALVQAFCNSTDLSHDNVTAYLFTRNPLLILSVWTSSTTWEPAGYAYFTVLKGEGATRFALGAFTFFADWWGKPEITLLGVLGLAYFFRQFGLQILIGEQYASNAQAARFLRQFGFHDVGIIQRYLVRDGKLVAARLVECLPEDFEVCAENILNRAITGNLNDRKGKKIIHPSSPTDSSA
jgi:hypothetical protein